MKKAIINVHGNPTLSRIVQELAVGLQFTWVGETKVQHTEKQWLCFDFSGKRITYCATSPDDPWFATWKRLDAGKITEVIAFFENPQPVYIALSSGQVTLNPDGSIKWHCGTVVSKDDVDAIVKARNELLKAN